MQKTAVTAFSILAFLCATTSGQHMICKAVQDVFSGGNNESVPTTHATVDYQRLSGMIKESIRQEFQELNSKIEELDRKVEELLPQASSRQCVSEHQDGLFYSGKCYFIPYVTSLQDLSYDAALDKCANAGGFLAEIHSLAHQKAVQDHFEPRIPPPRTFAFFWMGTTYRGSDSVLRFRSGKEVAIGEFHWHTGYPKSAETMAITMRNNDLAEHEGVFNYAGGNLHGVICEKCL